MPLTSVSITSPRLALCLNRYSPTFSLLCSPSAKSVAVIKLALSITPSCSSWATMSLTSVPGAMITTLSAGRGPGALTRWIPSETMTTSATAAIPRNDSTPLAVAMRGRGLRGGVGGEGGTSG